MERSVRICGSHVASPLVTAMCHRFRTAEHCQVFECAGSDIQLFMVTVICHRFRTAGHCLVLEYAGPDMQLIISSLSFWLG